MKDVVGQEPLNRTMEISKPFNREELQERRDKAEKVIYINRMPASWVMAYRQLAHAADYLDAMLARTELK